MDKKQILTAGIMGGILLWFIPSTVTDSATIGMISKALAMLVMAGAVIYFIAQNKSSITKHFDKDIQLKVSKGELTHDEAFEEQKKKIQQQILIEKQKLELEKEKSKIVALKTQQKPSEQGFKVPDILGNIGSLTGSSNTKKDNLDDLFGSSNKGGKKKENDLRDLF